MVTETELHYRQPCYDSVRMAQQQRQYSPTPETSAADAMLKLSGGSSSHHSGGGRGEYLYQSPKQGDHGANMYNAGQVEYRSPTPGSMTAASPCSPTSPMMSTTCPTSPRMRSNSLSRMQRKEREFVPDFRKDTHYWQKRQKNNEAAKRSREKRRVNDMVMTDKLTHMANEKHKLQVELDAIKRHFGLPLDKVFHSGDTSHSVSPVSSPCKTPGSDTTRSSPFYDNHNGSPPIKPAPPLIPLQGRLAEVIAQRMMSKPPPLEPVPDSPPVGSVSPVYPQHRQMYNNITNNSQILHSQRQHHQQQQQQQQQHYGTSQHYSMSVPVKQQPESPQSAASSDHPQFQYNMMYSQQQSPRSPSYSSAVHSPRSPQNLQIVMSPQHSDQSSQHHGDHMSSAQSYADHDSNRDDHSSSQAHDDLGAPLNLSKRRRIDLDEQDEEKQSVPVRAEQRKGIPHKLRYKNYSAEIREAEQDSNDGTSAPWHIPEHSSANPQLSMANLYQHTMEQHNSGTDEQGASYREVREARYSTSSSTHLESSMDVGSDNSQPSVDENNTAHQESPKSDTNAAADDDDGEADPKYLERRDRNNMAARKCRENRRMATELRFVKSQVLENENVQLKDELRNLSEEVHGLKKLIEKKHQAQEAGETFELPEDVLITKVEQNDQ